MPTTDQNKAPLPAVILAAGAGRRYGGEKLLASVKGHALLEWTLKKWSEHPLVESIILVVQPDAKEIAKLSSQFTKVVLVENPLWERGLGTSLGAGIRDIKSDGVLVGLADTPFFEDATLELVVPNSDEGERIRIPIYNGVSGHPKYFPSWCFEELQALSGDLGAKSVIKQHAKRCERLPCSDSGILRDFDVRADFV